MFAHYCVSCRTMTINFKFDRQNKTYFAGENVKCKATLELEHPVTLNSITIHYQGIGKTWWTDRSSHGGDEELYECFGSMEQYFHETFVCFQSFNERAFQPNIYTYNTEFKLPNTLPTSFFGRHGHVSYKIKMIITSHLINTILMENEEEFYVYSVINLNLYPLLNVPILKCKSKKIGILWFNLESITLTAAFPRRGFAIGEHINFVVQLNNQSTIDVIYIEISLKEQIICKDKRRTLKKSEENVIWKKCIGGVLKCQKKMYEINIPTDKDLTILLLDGADIMMTKYVVEIKAVTKSKEILISNDIIFGTIPYLKRNIKS